MSERTAFARRREEFMRALGPRGVAVFHSPPEAPRNGDQHHPFRQSSDLYYLTGFTEPQATLVLRPGASSERTILFVRPSDREREVWEGRRAGVEGAVARFGADAAYPVAELATRLPDLVANADDLCYGLGYDPGFDAVIVRTVADLRLRERRGQRPPLRVVDPRAILHEMRLRKSPEELALLRRAAAITAEAHVAAMSAAAPGVGEHELEALIDYTFRRRGGSGPGYGTIVGSGVNATILHYVDNDSALCDGDLVLIDAGCEYQFYTADVTRTFPASGRFTAVQRRVYQLVLDAQEEAIRAVRPGVTLEHLHAMVVDRLTRSMVDLGLLRGPAAARVEDEAYKAYYMHRTSHWLGLDVHDAGAYTDRDGAARPLEPGMVITIEPGLYVAADAESAPAELRGIGVRIEDDVLVTEVGGEVLTSAVPKRVDEVERACAARPAG